MFKVCRFYSWRIEEVMEMDLELFIKASAAMDALTHQEMLNNMTVVSFPDVEKNQRATLHKSIYQRAYPINEKKAVSLDEAARILRSKYGVG
jgi:hypothetical protein